VPSLYWLSLSGNKIAKIANGTVIDMPNLVVLDLENNKIAELEPGWVRSVPNLAQLGLQNNKIAELEPGWVRNVPNLQNIYLHNNPGAPFACSNVSSTFTTGCEMNRVANCGDECTFWVDGLRGWMLFKTGGPCTCWFLELQYKGIAKLANGTVSDIPNLQTLNLRNNEIAELEPGWLSNVPNLNNLEIWGNPLGCVSGIAEDVEIDYLVIEHGFYKTPLCPDNCNINTYYDSDNHVCLTCPENTYTDGIGAVNCTALAATTTTPDPLCHSEARPFSLAGDTLCVPNSLYPAPNVSHCVFGYTWRDLRSMKGSFSTGGLGKLMTDFEWEVWVCMEHPCATDKGDRVCFTFSEAHHAFVPWRYKSHLNVLKK